MDWSLSRSQNLQVLHSMGVEIPMDTKLNSDVLEKRLREALDAAQYKDRLPSPLKLHLLPSWPLKSASNDSRARSLFEAVQRGNMQEVQRFYETGTRSVSSLNENPFESLRDIMRYIGNNVDTGKMWCVLQDPTQAGEVHLRVVSVLEINQRTPAFIVLYRPVEKATVLQALNWVNEQVEQDLAKSGRFVNIFEATPLEQRLFLKILKLNAPLVPAEFKVERRVTEKSFKVSLLLPVGPLEYSPMAKLNSDLGCARCGKRAKSRCSSCQSISYCGPECQRSDWAEHKQTCRSIKGGTWHKVRLHLSMPGFAMDGMFTGLINKYTSLNIDGSDAEKKRQISESTPPPNAYGDKPFLVKFQLGLTPPGAPVSRHFMLYDRKRTFQAFVHRDDDLQTYAEFVREIQGPRGGYEGLKMYRWAKRVGEWEMSVCLDREPGTDVKW